MPIQFHFPIKKYDEVENRSNCIAPNSDRHLEKNIDHFKISIFIAFLRP